MKNFKMGLVVAILAIGAAMLIVIQYEAQIKLRAENESLTQQLAQLKTDNESLSNRHATIGDSKSLTNEQFNELLKLRGELGLLRQQTEDLGKLSEENKRLKAANLYSPGMILLENKLLEQQQALQATNEIIEQLAKILNVPNEIQMNVYAYTNLNNASFEAYQLYFKAVQSRDELSNFTAGLDKKIADEKNWLQSK